MSGEGKARAIYLLDPKAYGPETIAVTFAKTSRSPLSFQQIADELTAAATAQFHEKWVVGYGHASVAEHAVLHLAFENVSRLAVECLQSNRLASFTEKSTRYQQWNSDGFCCPAELDGEPLLEAYQTTIARLFKLYAALIQPAIAHLEQENPGMEGRKLRSTAIDSVRYLLPSAALANVGMTANARVLAHALRKMLSHPLHEVRSMGDEALRVAREEAPTLVRYVEQVPFMETSRAFQRTSVGEMDPLPATSLERVALLQYDPDAEDSVLAAMLFAQHRESASAIHNHVQRLNQQEKRALFAGWMNGRGAHDALPRETEMAVYTFDLVMDQGAYYEFKRHRMMTQIPQPLTANLGYEVPLLIEAIGAGDRYRRAMDHAGDAYRRLERRNPHVAAYLVPNGYRRRVLIRTNLRQLAHFCELRSTEKAHYAIREIAIRMFEAVRQVHPSLAAMIRVPEALDAEELVSASFVRSRPD